MSVLGDLSPLRDSLRAHGLLADKRLGQHFLLDLNITRKIAGLTGEFSGRTVIEVGPGPGGLTRALLETDATRVVAVEKDRRFLPLLEELHAVSNGRLTVVNADALGVDYGALAGAGHGFCIVANLPYNVATPLLIGWLTRTPAPLSMTLMFQKEVAERIVAAPGASAYGRLSVIAQAMAEARIAMTLPARAFTPPPRVDSAVVLLTPRLDRPEAEMVCALEAVTRSAFGQRRKMLRSSLKSLGGAALCEAAGIDADARAETIPIDGFLALARESLKGPRR